MRGRKRVSLAHLVWVSSGKFSVTRLTVTTVSTTTKVKVAPSAKCVCRAFGESWRSVQSLKESSPRLQQSRKPSQHPHWKSRKARHGGSSHLLLEKMVSRIKSKPRMPRFRSLSFLSPLDCQPTQQGDRSYSRTREQPYANPRISSHT